MWAAAFDPPQWIAYMFTSGVFPASVRIQHRNDIFWTSGQIKDIEIQSSDDGVTWSNEWVVGGISPMGRAEIRDFYRP